MIRGRDSKIGREGKASLGYRSGNETLIQAEGGGENSVFVDESQVYQG